MDSTLVIRSQCHLLLKLHEVLTDRFGGRKGSVQFFQHKDQHDIFVIQIRKGHLVDLGSSLMALSFLIKSQYHVFQGIAMREQLGMPKGGFPAGQDYEYAFKHVFLRFKFHPQLQEMLFNSECLKKDEVYQDMARMPYVIEDVQKRLGGEADGKK